MGLLRRLIAAIFVTPNKPRTVRNTRWPAVRVKHLAKEPTCQACGGKRNLEVHHIQPFHLFPERELDEGNLITLCESPGHNCHLTWGHFYNFQTRWNRTVRADLIMWRKKVAAA